MIRLASVSAAVALALATSTAAAAPVTYTIDPVHSRVSFYINHLGFSNSSGSFKVAEGSTLTFDNDNWAKSSVAVTIPVKSLELGDATWNSHILDKDWLDLGQFAEIRFKSTKLEKTDATHGKLYGDVTIHGVTKPVTLDLRVNKVGDHFIRKAPAAGFTATTVLHRSDFGVTAYTGAIGEDIDVRIEIESYVATPAAK
jgi:polyisoprenoid-binding protein YceI